MMKKTVIKIASAALICIFCLMSLSVCSGGGNNEVPPENQFRWWIFTADGMGIYYNNYEENPAIQWINNQYWDTKNHTLGSEGNGEKIAFSFQTPISGSESDNFTTMIATGEYPEIVELSMANPRALFQDGILMDITEYVHKHLPNYLAFLDENPEMKPLARDIDENGNEVYFALYGLYDNVRIPWGGHVYRRDWVRKYAKPTAYVWDWESEYVKQNEHPKITPLSAAEAANDFTGWKRNEVTAFTSSESSDPMNDYTDNVIFPSGMDFPYTISDWEWMLEAFKMAIEARGFGGNANAYPFTVFYMGHTPTGELASSFGGGNGAYYIDSSRKVHYGAISDNFKTYLEAMHNWYGKGWIDTRFETRAADMFFDINPAGYNQGMVGAWHGTAGYVGTAIRATCANEEDRKDAMVFGCPIPVNDMYGGEAQKFKAPDSMYQDSMLGISTGFTTKCEGKNMEALFSFFNWRYTFEGGLLSAAGLSDKQYNSMTYNPDTYAKIGITAAYAIRELPDGIKEIVYALSPDKPETNAIRANRLAPAFGLEGNRDRGYVMDRGYTKIVQQTLDYWTRYPSTSSAMNYNGLLNNEESNLMSRTQNFMQDYLDQIIPSFIKNGLEDWDTYVARCGKFNPQQVIDIYQKYIN